MRFNEPNVVSLFLGFAPKKNSCGVICTPILNFPSFFFFKASFIASSNAVFIGNKVQKGRCYSIMLGGVWIDPWSNSIIVIKH